MTWLTVMQLTSSYPIFISTDQHLIYIFREKNYCNVLRNASLNGIIYLACAATTKDTHTYSQGYTLMSCATHWLVLVTLYLTWPFYNTCVNLRIASMWESMCTLCWQSKTLECMWYKLLQITACLLASPLCRFWDIFKLCRLLNPKKGTVVCNMNIFRL
jgi:hypothetical protein